MKFFMIFIVFFVALVATAEQVTDSFIELGTVHWQRDLGVAVEQSANTGKPIFLLFQEVPGCSGCQTFGANVLSNPLLVEAIEDEFIPVVVYNNGKDIEDKKLLDRFREPAWNYQVVRFLNAKGRDIIPRKDGIWTLTGIATRAIKALKVAKRPIPNYLRIVATENDIKKQGVSAFAMSCFWIGERELGKIEGVISTEAGWIDGREVTRVVYHKDIITLKALARKAAKVKCAQKIYAPEEETRALKKFSTGQLTSRYRKASESDQKKQIAWWSAIALLPGITAMQMTKINAFAPSNMSSALKWLSPRQREALREAEQAAKNNAEKSTP